MFTIPLAMQNDTPLTCVNVPLIGNVFMSKSDTPLWCQKKNPLKPVPNYVKNISNCVLNCHTKLRKDWLNRSNLRAMCL